VAFGEAGDAAAAMAVEVGDYDGNGWLDILVPDMNRCCLYRNMGGGMFEDVSTRAGIARTMTHVHSWGGVFADFDLDGHLDMYITNGSACVLEAHPDRLYAGDGHGGFRPVSIGPSGDDDKAKFVSRGVADGDFDNDGDVDLVIVNLNDRPSLLRNDTPRRNRHWLEVQLVGRGPNRDALGALVKVVTATGTQIRPRRSAGSYLSQHDPRLHFGLGEHQKADRVEVTWPDGSTQALSEVSSDRLITIRQESSVAKKSN
jgi:hypothetical protein